MRAGARTWSEGRKMGDKAALGALKAPAKSLCRSLSFIRRTTDLSILYRRPFVPTLAKIEFHCGGYCRRPRRVARLMH